MCGIAGAVGYIQPGIVAGVRRISAAQTHRGPDDSGEWQSERRDVFNGAAFAFRRLAILDLSPQGHQPMLDPETGNVLVFNGEIYNFREVRAELQRLGHHFASTGDSEVLLVAYRQWGRECLPRLRGMFAFGLWDAAKGTVLLARDRLGIKPLYVAVLERAVEVGPTLLFASELTALLSSDLVARRLSPQGVHSYLWNGFVVGPGTIVEGVQQLPPGCYAEVDPACVEYRAIRWWEIPAEGPEPDGVDRFRAAIESSMRQHLVSDVPLGVFLSGGVDSSAMAALAVRSLGSADAVNTFNISFDEPEFDESRYAAEVARVYGSRHRDIRLTQSDFTGLLDDALDSLDQPTIDGINTYFVSRAVREAGMTVAIAGTGGDELLGGYQSFVDLPRLLRWIPNSSALRSLVLGPVTRMLLKASFAARAMPPQIRWGKLADIVDAGPSLLALYQVSYALFTRDFHHQLLGGDGLTGEWGLPDDHWRRLKSVIRGQSPLHAISQLELANFIGERLLRDTDAASMATSLEARVPLLDHEVVEAACRVPTGPRFHPVGRKMLLREVALGEAPPSLFDRPKSGFVLPIERWARETLSPRIDDLIADQSLCRGVGVQPIAAACLWNAYQERCPGLYWSRVWSIFILLHWCRRHQVLLE